MTDAQRNHIHQRPFLESSVIITRPAEPSSSLSAASTIELKPTYQELWVVDQVLFFVDESAGTRMTAYSALSNTAVLKSCSNLLKLQLTRRVIDYNTDTFSDWRAALWFEALKPRCGACQSRLGCLCKCNSSAPLMYFLCIKQVFR
jgi:hypothetical protein